MNKLRRNLFPSLLLGLPLNGMAAPGKDHFGPGNAQAADRHASKEERGGGGCKSARKPG